MPDTRILPFYNAGIFQEFTPAEVGINAGNLKSTTAIVGNVLALGGYTDFLLTLVVTNVGTALVGTAKITLDLYALDGSTILFSAFDIITGITLPTTATTKRLNLKLSSRGAGVLRNITAGEGFAAATLAAGTDILVPIHALKVTLTATTASDAATSSVGSLYLHASK